MEAVAGHTMLAEVLDLYTTTWEWSANCEDCLVRTKTPDDAKTPAVGAPTCGLSHQPMCLYVKFNM